MHLITSRVYKKSHRAYTLNGRICKLLHFMEIALSEFYQIMFWFWRICPEIMAKWTMSHGQCSTLLSMAHFLCINTCNGKTVYCVTMKLLFHCSSLVHFLTALYFFLTDCFCYPVMLICLCLFCVVYKPSRKTHARIENVENYLQFMDKTFESNWDEIKN